MARHESGYWVDCSSCLLCRCFYSRSFVPPPKPFCFESQHPDNPHVSLFSTVYLDKRISSEGLGTHLRAFSPSLHHPLPFFFKYTDFECCERVQSGYSLF